MFSHDTRTQLWFFVLLLSLLVLGASYGIAASPVPAGKGMSCHALRSGLPYRVCRLAD